VIWLFFLAETAVRDPLAKPDVQARASVRIERGVKVGAQEWKITPPEQRREVVRKAANGQAEVIRIVDFH
jgi:hypothetical protein